MAEGNEGDHLLIEAVIEYDTPLGYIPRGTVAMPGDSLPHVLTSYLMRRREALIVELRALDRALGLPQTIPTRGNSR